MSIENNKSDRFAGMAVIKASDIGFRVNQLPRSIVFQQGRNDFARYVYSCNHMSDMGELLGFEYRSGSSRLMVALN